MRGLVQYQDRHRRRRGCHVSLHHCGELRLKPVEGAAELCTTYFGSKTYLPVMLLFLRQSLAL